MKLLVFVMCAAAYAAQDRRALVPVDEAVSRPDFFTFRARLATAVAERSPAAILDAVHPQIKNSFGGDGGIEEFKQMWRLEQPDSTFWKEFGTVLALGGSFDGAGAFTAPYTFSRWPDDIDAFDYVAVVGSDVRIRTLPRADAPVLRQVSHFILQLDNEPSSQSGPGEDWTAVKIDGKKGYVATRFVRSPTDYRATFRYTDGRWWLVFFVAGD